MAGGWVYCEKPDVFYDCFSMRFVNHCTGRDYQRMKSELAPIFTGERPAPLVKFEDIIAEDEKVAARITHFTSDGKALVELLRCVVDEGKITDVWTCFRRE